jgi:hypothetical protein
MIGHRAELSDHEVGGSVLFEQLCLLFIGINMMSIILCQVVELSDILIHIVGPML